MAKFELLAWNPKFTANLDAFTAASVGVREHPLGSNDGPEVRIYLRGVGEYKPCAWCDAYVNHQVKNAASKAGLFSKWLATSNCNESYSWAKRNGLIIPRPIPGKWCVFLLRHKTDVNRHIHTGFVKMVLSNGRLVTREGNTNDDGSANGDGVYEKDDRVADSSRMVYVNIV